MHPIKRPWKPALGLTLFLLGTFWATVPLNQPPHARAGVTKAPPKESFLAGSERSIPILNEISATLKRIDARLARLEEAAMQSARQQPDPSTTKKE